MRRSNDHELEIARSVDKISIEGRLYSNVIPEVAGSLGFMMSRSDSEFLVSYIRWRMENPIAKLAGPSNKQEERHPGELHTWPLGIVRSLKSRGVILGKLVSLQEQPDEANVVPEDLYFALLARDH